MTAPRRARQVAVSMPEGTFVGHLPECPECGAEWFYMVGDGEYSRVIGIVENDRIAGWRCPDCGHEWPRGFRVVS